jgi:BlaI family transcriptional regulator, penicillinase repressor
LTGQELEIMKVVWQRESATVRDVYEALLERRKVAYTTVMTMMKILEQKKYLKKTQTERAHVYRPAQPQGQVIGAMVREFVNRVFNGSAEPLLAHLVKEHDLSHEDLEEIARLRRQL